MKCIPALVLIVISMLAGWSPAANPNFGMNLEGPADWSCELPLVDVFRFSREWISQRQGAGWGNGPALELDEHGWVKKLESGCFAETPICTIEGGHYPSGVYTVLYDGEGKIEFAHAAKVVRSEPGKLSVEVDAGRGGFFLRLMETNPNDYVHNIRMIMPGFESTWRENPFHPVFLKRWEKVACFRFMDWMHTNGSKVSTWADRPTMQTATFTTKGMPLELMIDLCNRQQADAWFCIPHLADDAYVRNFAAMVKERLAPERAVFIEYSNEVWNSMFEQNRHAQAKAKELNLGDPSRPWEGGCYYFTRRSVEIFRIFEQVFGSRDRLVRVLAWQAAGGSYWLDGMLFKEAGPGTVDALAIAPYVSMNVPARGDRGLTADEVAGWTVDQVLDHVQQKALPESIGWIDDAAAVARKHKVRLLAYEGGQHLVGVGGGENNDALTRLFHAANAHPRMGEVYTQYLKAWDAVDGGLFCMFSSVGRWSKWGSWGLLQHYDDDESKSPKFQAVMKWAEQQPPLREGSGKSRQRNGPQS